MNLFIIIYSGANLIIGTVGPLPYGINECTRRVTSMQEQADAKPDIAQGMRFKCEWTETRPQLQER